MKRYMFEPVSQTSLIFSRPMNLKVWVADMGVLAVERLHFKCKTLHVPNLMHKLLKFYSTSLHCIPLDVVKGKICPTNVVWCMNQPSNMCHSWWVLSLYMKSVMFELGLNQNFLCHLWMIRARRLRKFWTVHYSYMFI